MGKGSHFEGLITQWTTRYFKIQMSRPAKRPSFKQNNVLSQSPFWNFCPTCGRQFEMLSSISGQSFWKGCPCNDPPYLNVCFWDRCHFEMFAILKCFPTRWPPFWNVCPRGGRHFEMFALGVAAIFNCLPMWWPPFEMFAQVVAAILNCLPTWWPPF